MLSFLLLDKASLFCKNRRKEKKLNPFSSRFWMKRRVHAFLFPYLNAIASKNERRNLAYKRASFYFEGNVPRESGVRGHPTALPAHYARLFSFSWPGTRYSSPSRWRLEYAPTAAASSARRFLSDVDVWSRIAFV